MMQEFKDSVNDKRNMIVFGMTSSYDAIEIQRGWDCGMDYILLKPFEIHSIHQLVNIIHTHRMNKREILHSHIMNISCNKIHFQDYRANNVYPITYGKFYLVYR